MIRTVRCPMSALPSRADKSQSLQDVRLVAPVQSNWLPLVNHPLPSLVWSPTHGGARPRNQVMTSQMPASVHSLADATRKPNENVDAVIRHYKAINDELEAQLAVALAQRDAWRKLVEHFWQLIDAAGPQT